ncbi:MAG: hypothetical protein M1816_006421 [Peltula sp. TS41687]|nr:MAG: hypothetical protein M1816_006421 [Peltula sp. TS41687]
MPFQSMVEYVGSSSPFSSSRNDHPISPSEWQTALFQVKMLYLDRQYTQCQERCKQLLLLEQTTNVIPQLHPIQITYLCTYAAICQENTARSLHPLSPTKLPLMFSARECYLRAISSLSDIPASSFSSSFSSSRTAAAPSSSEPSRPSSIVNLNLGPGLYVIEGKTSPPLPTPPPPTTATMTTSSTSYSSFTSSSSLSSFSFSDFGREFAYEDEDIDDEAEHEEDEKEDEEEITIKISPLRIRKAAATPAILTEPDEPHPTMNTSTSTITTPNSPSPISSPPLLFSTTFLHHLTTLQPLLQSHLSSLNTTISTTHLDQENRQIRLRLQHSSATTTTNNNAAAAEEEEGEEEEEEMRRRREKKERVRRLRNSGWKRERFEPERYRALAGAALADL